jgi:N-acetyl sugar amidotransferase
MKYCKRCLYPANHPLYITFDEQGVCSGCRVHEEKDLLNWDERFNKLSRIVDKYRNTTGNSYDCIVPIRGGADSYFITHVITKQLKLNPLLVTYNHEFNTKVGIRNQANLLTAFDCDHIMYTLDPDKIRRITHHTLKKYGSMYWHVLAGNLTFPVQVAVKFKIPLIIWGVHGWSDQVGMFSHLDEVEMTKKARKEHGLMCLDAEDVMDDVDGVSRRDIQPYIYPFDEELERVGVRGIYLSNYIRWDSKKQHEHMISQYGYETALQERTFNTYEDVDCFHSAGVHDYIKFLKYGYGKVTDHASREIRLKRLTREEGIELVKRYHDKRPRDMDMLLRWLGISERDFYNYIDPWRDQQVWQTTAKGKWNLVDSVLNHAEDDGVDPVRLHKTDGCSFAITPLREPVEKEDEYILMGRGYIDRYNYKAIGDDQEEIQKTLSETAKKINEQINAPEYINDRDAVAFENKEMSYCRRCLMPNTKPGVFIDEQGICSACRSVEKKKEIDWQARARELQEICDSIRGTNGNGYDCIVPVSGGKDSTYQSWMMKRKQNLHVLGVIVVPHLQTREGIANLNNMVRSLNIDLIKISLKHSVFKDIRRRAFFDLGEPNWADHCSVFAGVARVSYLYHVPLVVWGEDVAVEFGGSSQKRVSSAEDLLRNDLIRKRSIKDFYNGTVQAKYTFFYSDIGKDDIKNKGIRSIYLGYYVNWDGYTNLKISEKLGFVGRQLGPLSGNILNYDNMDEKQCEINIWFKFLKFGFWRPTDQACYWIWNGHAEREKLVELVNQKQYEFPVEYFKDFLNFNNISEPEFWINVNKWRNRNIWKYEDGRWQLKTSLKNT